MKISKQWRLLFFEIIGLILMVFGTLGELLTDKTEYYEIWIIGFIMWVPAFLLQSFYEKKKVHDE